MVVSVPNVDDTPRHKFLKRSIRELTNEIQIKNKRMKNLQQKVGRQNKKITSLKNILLEKKNLINDDIDDTLL